MEDISGSVAEHTYEFLLEKFQKKPFEILRDASGGDINKQELYDYCMTNMTAQKYKNLEMSDGFITALSAVAVTVNPDAFIALQDKLLAETADKTSYWAGKILQRKIDFYHQLNQPEQAWKILEDNIQIESFRKQVVDAYLANEHYAEAKKLILDFIAGIPVSDSRPRPWSRTWDLLLLDIALKQKDIPLIRELSFMFIRYDFKKEYFNMYKSAFSEAEWKTERERLIAHYQTDKSFSKSVAAVLIAEKLPERLLNYIESYLSIEYLAQYHPFFAAEFPEKTIRLFRVAIDKFAEHSIGKKTHTQIVVWLNMMSDIRGGKEVADEMASEYKVRYKTRKLLCEMLYQNGF
jgi:hypothetical protein